jgi:prepilin-type N-terminal cleavage/methylation domain-containing protein
MMRVERRAGFTLIEVVCAVAILGILYTVLATSAIEALRAEGTGIRRIEASLLADTYVMQLEDVLESAGAPPIGETEEDHDPFTLALIVRPVAAIDLGVDPALLGESDVSALGVRSDEDSRLREIQVRVSWHEGVQHHVVSRTTYGHDTTGLEGAFAAASGVAGGGPEGEDGDSGGDGGGSGSGLRGSDGRSGGSSGGSSGSGGAGGRGSTGGRSGPSGPSGPSGGPDGQESEIQRMIRIIESMK